MSTLLDPVIDAAALQALAQTCNLALDLDDPHGPQTWPRESESDAASAPAVSPPLASGALALLTDWSVIGVEGADAASFLHSQSTNDVAEQPIDAVDWHGFASPGGRLLAGGPLWRDTSGNIRLAVARALAAPLAKRLSRYVMRAKARVTDLGAELAVLGLAGQPAAETLDRLSIQAPQPRKVAQGADGVVVIGLPAAPTTGPRWWLIAPQGGLAALWSELARNLPVVPSSAWRAGEILAGEPRIVAATTEAHIAQTLNWDLIGAVNFKKGCYPGQEVIARLHYRGTPKRRMAAALIEGDALPAPGDPLLDQNDAPAPSGNAQPQGSVISAAPAPRGLRPAQATDAPAGADVNPRADVDANAGAGSGARASVVLLYEAPLDPELRSRLVTADGRRLSPLPLPTDSKTAGATPGEAPGSQS